jgi:fructose-1,6-bisphosphatase/inositol monophosphatase family enzyme
VQDGDYLPLLTQCADAVGSVVESARRRGFSGLRPTQYHIDLDADRAALSVLSAAPVRVVSEESGESGDGDVTIVIDPIDGSTNCDRGIPFFSVSIAVVRDGHVTEGLVRNLATGTTYTAVHGSGAFRDGAPIHSSDATSLSSAIVSFSGLPLQHWGWYQARAMGAASLECCLVADGSLDAYVVTPPSALHPWDYLAGLLIAREAGAVVCDAVGLDLEITEAHPRHPIFASTQALMSDIQERRPKQE